MTYRVLQTGTQWLDPLAVELGTRSSSSLYGIKVKGLEEYVKVELRKTIHLSFSIGSLQLELTYHRARYRNAHDQS